MKLKYIIIDGVSPVIFGVTTKHVEAARTAGGLPITGAGFCSARRLESGRWTVNVWGESVSLNSLKAKADDIPVLEYLFNEV